MAQKGNFWLGMVIGAAAGAATALLYAPKRGEELRHDISEKASDAGRKAGQAWGSVKQSTSTAARSVKERTQQAVGKGQEIMQDYKGRMCEAVQSGRETAEEKRKELKAEMEESERKAEMKS